MYLLFWLDGVQKYLVYGDDSGTNNIGSISDVTSATPTKQWSFNVSGPGWLGWETAPVIVNNTVYDFYH